MSHEWESPFGWSEDHPRFRVPEWINLECGFLSPQDAGRHFLLLGETGSGKTVSGIMPFLRAIIEYPSRREYIRYEKTLNAKGRLPEARQDLRPGMLVMDPKSELLHYILELLSQEECQRELVCLNSSDSDHVISLFEGMSPGELKPFEIGSRILSVSTYLRREDRAREPFWGKQARDIIKALLSADYHVFREGGIEFLKIFWSDIHEEVIGSVKKWKASAGAEGRAGLFQETYAKFNEAMDKVRSSLVRISLCFEESGSLDAVDGAQRSIRVFAGAQNDLARGRAYDNLVERMEELIPWCRKKIREEGIGIENAECLVDFVYNAQQIGELGDRLACWDSSGPEPDPQLIEGLEALPIEYSRSCYLRSLYALLNVSTIYHRDSPPSDPVLEAYLKVCRDYDVPPYELLRIEHLIYMPDRTYACIIAVINGVLEELASPDLARSISLNPYELPDPDRYLSISESMEKGACILFNPGAGHKSSITDIVGRCVKSKFFEFSFKREDRTRPLVYLCDEFQRYVTGDEESGEQSFLDRCRAYRVICMLATQSLASLRYALSVADTESAGPEAMDASLQILLNNTGNKFFFRSTDLATQRWLKEVVPSCHTGAKPHVLDVRPVSSLQVGECYTLLTSGKFGLGKAVMQPCTTPPGRRRASAREPAGEEPGAQCGWGAGYSS